MKKFFLLWIIVFAFISLIPDEGCAWYKRTSKDGRDNGYGNVTYDYVLVERTKTYTNIWCEHSGGSYCPSAVEGSGRPPDATTAAEQIGVDYALDAIAQGILYGSWEYEANHDDYTVEWTSSDTLGTDSEIEVQADGEIIP